MSPSTATHQRSDLLEKAWALPVARLYAPLLSQGLTSVCGPTSVANVLRSMGVQARRNPLRGLGLRPMSLDQVVRESGDVVPEGWQVSAVRPATVEALRTEVRASNEGSVRFIANFTRVPLFGGGGGHHSPIGGYLEEEDLVFVLDVNARFGPWLVSPARLFEALDTYADRARTRMRGLARFTLEGSAGGGVQPV